MQVLTAEAPLIWPTPISVPADSDSPLASGALKTALKSLSDRTDWLKARTVLIASYEAAVDGDGVIDSSSAPTGVWNDVEDTRVNVPNVKAGDLIEVWATYRLRTTGSNSVRARLNYNGAAVHRSTRTTEGDVWVEMHARIVAPADALSAPLHVEILPDGADDVEILGFGSTLVNHYRKGGGENPTSNGG